MRARQTLAAAAAAVLLTACGGTAPPPTARSIAARIPGCGHFMPPALGSSVYAKTEITCESSYAWADVATFSSSGSELSWMKYEQASGTGVCCLDGSGWAADIQFKSIPANPWQVKVQRAIGGKWVAVP